MVFNMFLTWSDGYMTLRGIDRSFGIYVNHEEMGNQIGICSAAQQSSEDPKRDNETMGNSQKISKVAGLVVINFTRME